MCGITGIWSREAGTEELRELAGRMTATLRHRGPDGEGVWVDIDAGVGLGHRRLAIIDLSDQGKQPMSSASGRYVLTYNGEIYNYLELRARLESLGQCFRGHSDTEVLLAAFEEWGVERAVGQCIGMFAFGLWDRHEHRLVLGRDRLGKKPLYYGHCGRDFVFASELKALLAHPRFDREIDLHAQELFLQYGFVPAPMSIFRGVSKLLPGHLLVLDLRVGGEPTCHAYWSMHDVVTHGQEQPFAGNEEEAEIELLGLLRDAVRLRLRSDVSLGVFLSGGIDSSLVAALMQEQCARPVKAFTVGFAEQDYDEAGPARAVAKHLGCEHTAIRMEPGDLLAQVRDLPEAYDEPFADVSQLPTLLVSQLARRQVTVAMSGDGGDESFGGYNRHVLAQRYWPLLQHIPHWLRRFLARIPGSMERRTWEAVAAILPGPVARLRNPVEKWRKGLVALAASDLRSLYHALLSQGAVPTGPEVRWGTGSFPIPKIGGISVAEQIMYLDTLWYLPDDILVKVDRAAMHSSLEPRAPLLDHRVVEFAWTLPLNFKIRKNRGKYILQSLLSRYLPPALFIRPKTGFGVPIDTWLRGALRDWANDTLATLPSDSRLPAGHFRSLWNEHSNGIRNHGHQLWAGLMLGAWYEHWDRRASA